MEKMIDIAVVGAASPAGEALISVLGERKFPLGQLYAVQAAETDEEYVEFRGDDLPVHSLDGFDFSQVQLAIFLTAAAVSAEYVTQATQNGCIVIDTSAAFRLDEDVPLVVASVNDEMIGDCRQRDLIATPFTPVVALTMALKPIADVVGINSIQLTAMLSVSEQGKPGQEELGHQTISMLTFQDVKRDLYPAQIAFNLLPLCGVADEAGHGELEIDLVRGAQKVLKNDKINIAATVIQAPVFYGHSLSVHITTNEPVTADRIGEILDNSPDVIRVSSHQPGDCPSPVSTASGKGEVYIGRIREDLDAENGISLWIVADNIRRGIAINSVQIAEILVKDYL